MRESRFTDEQIVGIRKEAAACGKTAEFCRPHGIAREELYRWGKKYGGLKLSEAKRLGHLVVENRQLERAVAAQALNVQILLGRQR